MVQMDNNSSAAFAMESINGRTLLGGVVNIGSVLLGTLDSHNARQHLQA